MQSPKLFCKHCSTDGQLAISESSLGDVSSVGDQRQRARELRPSKKTSLHTCICKHMEPSRIVAWKILKKLVTMTDRKLSRWKCV